MSRAEVEPILKEVEELLCGSEGLPEVVEVALRKLLNVVEALCSDKQELLSEVDRLKKRLEEKKRSKTTAHSDDSSPSKNVSSDKRRLDLEKQPRVLRDRRSGKDLEIHETIPCPIDPSTLPPDAIRIADESVIVQDIVIKPHNIEFRQEVYYSLKEKKFYRGALPEGYDTGDFGPDLRALILSLKYCGNMSEPKIAEFLENFEVEVSSGSLSNILTATASEFEDAYHQVLLAGLSSTAYQQTDDTSARVAGQPWHTHILCNPYYTFYSTRPNKDRLNVLAVLQNVERVRYRFNAKTLELLEKELKIAAKWHAAVRSLIEQQGGEVELDAESLKKLLDQWLGTKCPDVRTSICHAAAIVYYRQQTVVPVVEVLVCDDAGQFKLLTESLALCWIHQGRHYERLSPIVPSHQQAKEDFLDQYWTYYGWLQAYRASPSEQRASELRAAFVKLFSTRTGYDALDDRIATTATKQSELLTVLDHPSAPVHNNDSELGARVSARRRDVSLHSRSKRGTRSMDIFTTIVQTCKKVLCRPYEYFRLHLRRDPQAPSLANLIRAAASDP